jgi:AcrR family transcriptional regulator
MIMKRNYRHGDVRGAALRAARAVVEADGTASLSLRAIARDVGVSHAALYRHFADRDALLAELGIDALQQLTRVLSTAFARADDPLARVDAIAKAYFRFALREPGLYRVAFVLPRKADYPALREAADATEAVPLRALDALVEAGLIPRAQLRLLAPTLWALLHGFSTLAIDGQFTEGIIALDRGATRAIEQAMLAGVRRVLGVEGGVRPLTRAAPPRAR